MSKTWKLVVVLLVATAALVSCGGDDDDDAEASAEVDAEIATDEDLEDLGAFASGECAEASAAFLSAAGGASSAISGTDEDLEQSLDQLEAFADVAPDEIKDDFEVVVDAYAEMVEIFADLDFDPNSGEPPSDETMAALAEVGERFDDGDLQEAQNNITGWFEENCGADR
jgi:hypothetical protein